MQGVANASSGRQPGRSTPQPRRWLPVVVAGVDGAGAASVRWTPDEGGGPAVTIGRTTGTKGYTEHTGTVLGCAGWAGGIRKALEPSRNPFRKQHPGRTGTNSFGCERHGDATWG